MGGNIDLVDRDVDMVESGAGFAFLHETIQSRSVIDPVNIPVNHVNIPAHKQWALPDILKKLLK